MASSLHDANQKGVVNSECRLDLYRLMELLVQARGQTRAVLFGSLMEASESMWRRAVHPGFEVSGFEVVALERGFSGKDERVDTSVVTRMCRDAYRFADPAQDRIAQAGRDGDYEPTVRQLVSDGFQVTVLYWSHDSRELRKAATAFHVLDGYIADLALV